MIHDNTLGEEAGSQTPRPDIYKSNIRYKVRFKRGYADEWDNMVE